MILNLRQMAIVRAVLREGTVSAAAQALSMSQPAASEMLRSAEVRCRIPLFLRDRGRLIPTPQALRLRDEIDAILSQAEQLDRVILQFQRRRDEAMSLGSVYGLSLALMPKIVARLVGEPQQKPPTLLVERRAELAAQVAAGSLDAAFTFLSDRYPGVTLHPICERPVQFLCRPGHRFAERRSVRLEEILDERLIGYMANLQFQQRLDAVFGERGLTFMPLARVEQTVHAWALVEAGQGTAIVPPFCMLEGFFPNLRVLTVEDMEPVWLEMTCRSDRVDTGALSILERIVQEVLAT